MYAMEFDHTGRIMFSPAPIPADVVAGLGEEFGGQLLADVHVDITEDYDTWPEGAEMPEQVLCVSRADPRRYRVFKYRREIDERGWEVAGRSWSWLDSEDQWRNFLRLYSDIERMAREATGVEAPEDAFDADASEDLAHSGRVG